MSYPRNFYRIEHPALHHPIVLETKIPRPDHRVKWAAMEYLKANPALIRRSHAGIEWSNQADSMTISQTTGVPQ